MSDPNSPWPIEASKGKRLTVNDTANLLAHNNHSDGDHEEVVSAQAAAGATAVMDGSGGDSMAINSSSSSSPLIWGCSAAGVLLVLLSVSLFVAKKVRRGGVSTAGGGGQNPASLGRKSDVFKAEPINETTSTKDTTPKGHFKNSKSLVDVELGLQMQQQQLRDELAEEEEEEAAAVEGGGGVSLSRNPSLLETLTSYVWPMSASPIDPPPTTAPPPVPTEDLPAPPDSRLIFNAALNRDSLGSILEAPMNYEVRVSTERPKHDLRVINRLSNGQVTDGEEEEEEEGKVL